MSLCRLNALPLSGPHPLSHYPHSPAYPCPVLISPLSPARELVVPSSRVVIVEGIYALSDRLRPLLDLRVSITGGVHFDLVKRVMRDIGRSGQAPQEIIHQISETVRRGGREAAGGALPLCCRDKTGCDRREGLPTARHTLGFSVARRPHL